MVVNYGGDLLPLALNHGPREIVRKPPIVSATPRATPPAHLMSFTARPFAVGLAVAEEDLGDRTGEAHSPGSSPLFVRGIMHRAVNPRCFVATVLYDATSSAIAAQLAVPDNDVEFVWLAGVRDPVLPVTPSAPVPASLRFRPQVVTRVEQGGGEVAADMDAGMEAGGEQAGGEEARASWGRDLDRRRFADLFASERQVDKEVLELGNTLIGKLAALAGTAESFPRYIGPRRRRNTAVQRRAVKNSSNSDSCSSSGMVDSGSSSADAKRRCGFDVKGAHIDVEVMCEGLAICKTGSGLYRTARSSSVVAAGDGGKASYFEVVVVEDGGAGGICVGVASEALPLNKLVGSNQQSFGLHSTGQVVSNGGEFREFGRGFKRGDRVGCMVRVQPAASAIGSDGDAMMMDVDCAPRAPCVEISYWINGEYQGKSVEELWEGVPLGKQRLYASVSLYKKGSKVVMQCCESDWATSEDTLRRAAQRPEAICSGRARQSSGVSL